MAKHYDLCIRGAGIVGRTLALLLARERLNVALVGAPQAAGSERSDIRAYALNATSRALLESLRCWPEAEHATAVLHMQVQGDAGGEVSFDAADQHVPALAWIVDVPALEARLAEAARYQPHIDLVPEPVAAPLTVVCEGRASHTRSELGVHFDVSPYPQTALAARVHCAMPHMQTARQWFSADGILAFLPLGGADGKEVAVVWSVTPERAQGLMEQSDATFASALAQASGGALGVLQVQGQRCIWPLQLARAERWCGPLGSAGSTSASWVLAGDAAHTVHPLSGQGLNLGLGDVQALARLLHARSSWRSVADLRVLRQYERERKAALLPMRLTTDLLAQLFSHPQPALQALRNWGMQGFDHSGPLKSWAANQAMHPDLFASSAAATGHPIP
jgi:2-polyprenyl-6-methoxyphenol hydroxylase-like FAD-dependent oxidoreductase